MGPSGTANDLNPVLSAPDQPVPLTAVTGAKRSNMAYESNGTPPPPRWFTQEQTYFLEPHTLKHIQFQRIKSTNTTWHASHVFTHHLVTVFAFDGNGAVFAVAGLTTVACHHRHVCTCYTQQTWEGNTGSQQRPQKASESSPVPLPGFFKKKLHGVCDLQRSDGFYSRLSWI